MSSLQAFILKQRKASIRLTSVAQFVVTSTIFSRTAFRTSIHQSQHFLVLINPSSPSSGPAIASVWSLIVPALAGLRPPPALSAAWAITRFSISLTVRLFPLTSPSVISGRNLLKSPSSSHLSLLSLISLLLIPPAPHPRRNLPLALLLSLYLPLPFLFLPLLFSPLSPFLLPPLLSSLLYLFLLPLLLSSRHYHLQHHHLRTNDYACDDLLMRQRRFALPLLQCWNLIVYFTN